jgi:hypothetical protein
MYRDWTQIPSRPVDIAQAPDFSRRSKLQPARATPFVPDPDFYNAINCEVMRSPFFGLHIAFKSE